jgi:general secretion pathway protein A
MYNGFFGFERSPFELSPDPHFFFPLDKSKEALASIYYALCQRKGFVVMTGEVGTGKTLLIRCLMELLKRQQIPFANVFNPRLSDIDFLTYVSFDLGIKVTDRSKSSLLRGLYSFLLVQLQKGLTTVLVVDEAHQMPLEVLEEIRLLTNLETSQQKLIQILLVGQPEFESRLDSFDLRQLKQRIAVRCRLEPYTIVETRQYVERRLARAGAGPTARSIFPLDTVESIQRYSLGIPRLINSICDQALVAAYARQMRTVPVELIDEVASYFRLQPVPELVENFENEDRAADHREAANYIMQVIESIKRKPAVAAAGMPHRVFP